MKNGASVVYGDSAVAYDVVCFPASEVATEVVAHVVVVRGVVVLVALAKDIAKWVACGDGKIALEVRTAVEMFDCSISHVA